MLGVGFAVRQAIAQLQHQAFALGQEGQHPVYLFQGDTADNGFLQIVLVGSKNVHEGNVVSFPISADGVGEGNVTLAFPGGTKSHEDFICYPHPNAFLMH